MKRLSLAHVSMLSLFLGLGNLAIADEGLPPCFDKAISMYRRSVVITSEMKGEMNKIKAALTAQTYEMAVARDYEARA